ncbi:SIR2 family protein [Roseivirga pacifica]|uniref:SIR2 family protein n=1 Tax=Roseivirga pacifica TaxID=1267423 RepID=UPI003BAA6D8D
MELWKDHYYYRSGVKWMPGKSKDVIDYSVDKIRPLFCEKEKVEVSEFNYEGFYSELNSSDDLQKSAQLFIQYIIKQKLKLTTENISKSLVYRDFKEPIIEASKNGFEVHIASLNHDLLVEELFHSEPLFSDGFLVEAKEPLNVRRTIGPSEEDVYEPVREFTKTNWSKINLYKLHGSIDLYSVQNDETFFKCPFHPDWVIDSSGKYKGVNFQPLFVTGKKPNDLYLSHKLISKLYEKYSNSLVTSEKLIVIGYGFEDDVVNDIIIDKYLECEGTEVYIVDKNEDKSVVESKVFSKLSSINKEGVKIFNDGFEGFVLTDEFKNLFV